MKKFWLKFTAIFLLISLIFLTLPSIASASDTMWKQHLKDFLQEFPSLFDPATVKRISDYRASEYNHDYMLNSMPSDAIDDLVPYIYKFYDLDNDNIPEVIITYTPIAPSGVFFDIIYKLYGTSYELLKDILAGESIYYTNSQNRLVIAKLVDDMPAYLGGIYFGEIKNKKIVYSDYIDSNGSNTYKGMKYNSLDKLNLDWNINAEDIDSTLKMLPEFNCSDVINSIKNGTPLSISSESIDMPNLSANPLKSIKTVPQTKNISVTFGATRYILNGEPFDQQTIVYDGVAYLPAAYLATKLGLHAKWDSATNITTLTSTGVKSSVDSSNVVMPATNPVTKTITATFGSTKYILNGELFDEDTIVYDGVAYLPAAYLATKLGVNAKWDSATNITTLISK